MSNAAACVRRRETLLLIRSHCFLCSMFPWMFFLLCNWVRPREHIWIFKEMIHQGMQNFEEAAYEMQICHIKKTVLDGEILKGILLLLKFLF
ncbi:hypothetical protein TNCT_406891 [Trichonephila clavata]|uniref:Uncharacterized protein n=1 Tax=Trichonephila clavata TaxID=2740835 RepID=A0A8X6GYQ2_TRICU|nr:hypothetical protein TNCT_406891 [Trichonephila clavata]